MSRLTDPAHRREARLALAMLPAGATVLIVSIAAFVGVAALALATPFRGQPGWGWMESWSLCAAALALRNARSGIEMMSAFDWRPLPSVLALSAAILAGWPVWWLD